MMKPRDKIMELFDDKIKALEDDLNKAVKAGMPSSILYDEIDELEALQEEIDQIFDFYCNRDEEINRISDFFCNKE